MGWLIEDLLTFITECELYLVEVDGCSLGMVNSRGEPILKRWRFATTSARMAEALGQWHCKQERCKKVEFLPI